MRQCLYLMWVALYGGDIMGSADRGGDKISQTAAMFWVFGEDYFYVRL